MCIMCIYSVLCSVIGGYSSMVKILSYGYGYGNGYDGWDKPYVVVGPSQSLYHIHSMFNLYQKFDIHWMY